MIVAALLAYIGVKIGAPTWFYVVTAILFILKTLGAGMNLKEKAG